MSDTAAMSVPETTAAFKSETAASYSSTAVTGSPAYEYTAALRSQALSRNLPDLEKRIKELEQILERLINEKVAD